MSHTPEELRAAADAFAKLGRPAQDPFGVDEIVADALARTDALAHVADAVALVEARERGDLEEVARIKARMDAWDAAHPGTDDEDEDEDEL